jgi:hypothetical protein
MEKKQEKQENIEIIDILDTLKSGLNPGHVQEFEKSSGYKKKIHVIIQQIRNDQAVFKMRIELLEGSKDRGTSIVKDEIIKHEKSVDKYNNVVKQLSKLIPEKELDLFKTEIKNLKSYITEAKEAVK